MLVCCIACEHKRICFMLCTCVEYEIPNTKVSECMNQIFIFFWLEGWVLLPVVQIQTMRGHNTICLHESQPCQFPQIVSAICLSHIQHSPIQGERYFAYRLFSVTAS